MILLETSAILFALQHEPGSERLLKILDDAKFIAVGSPNILEAGLVMTSRRIDGKHAVEGFIRDCHAEVLDFKREHSEAALNAFLRFGKGRHPARLNFGDCMSYAFARLSGLKLLYTGEDFGLTDLEHMERLD